MADLATPLSGSDSGKDVEETSIEKFKTGKDRDKAYLEAEKSLTEQSTKIKELERKYDEMLVAQSQAAQQYQQQPQQQEFTDVYKSQAEQEALKRFYGNPMQYIKDSQAAAVRDAVGYTQNLLAHQSLVDNFKRDNPDLAKHEKVVAMFVQGEPQALPPQERLQRAAKKARDYLLDIAGKAPQGSESFNPDTYVESPSSRQHAQPKKQEDKEQSPDEVLAEYTKERSNWTNKRRISG